MKQNYNITRLFITHILFVSLCLQSCSYFNNYSVPAQEEAIKTQDKLTIQAILDKQLMSQGGHIVTFSEEAGKLKARVQVNPLDEVDKVYNEIPVVIEKGTELASLSHLPKKIQQRRIQVKFDENGKPIRIAVHQPWLMGGGDNDGEQQKKEDIRRGKQKAKEGDEEMTDACSQEE